MKSLSQVHLLVTPWTAAHQSPPSMGFSRQEYWSGVPLPSPCHLYLGEPKSPLYALCSTLPTPQGLPTLPEHRPLLGSGLPEPSQPGWKEVSGSHSLAVCLSFLHKTPNLAEGKKRRRWRWGKGVVGSLVSQDSGSRGGSFQGSPGVTSRLTQGAVEM